MPAAQVDKKQAILEAALEEFRQKGYEAASTNQITKAAKVSKGILFHYFSDKKTLYLTLVEECIERYYGAMTSNLSELPADLFAALEQLANTKIEVFKSDPVRYGFISNVFINIPEPLKAELEVKQQQMQYHFIPLLANRLDPNQFRNGIDAAQAIEFVLLSLEALITKRLSMMKDKEWNVDEIAEAIDTSPYIEMLKYGIYRKDEHV
ncbi:TetR/AcrR family transcriptional regulator [Paenibacillus arenosi]|uniref:TetR/AcrR family transcriptional regulator n=1 Tax=Paenibacillus arenosi TaxID=2774142 RepID=A0ABR9AYM4_9BACL|nr:TetR/AcrR family transcriptional regulator [Paenibacillus arenosi]MBD8498305.1 TetR/AcrR family transcriptional regulator [Paenibacillus arenosi]